MVSESGEPPVDAPVPGEPPVDYESTPLSRSEYIAAIVHLYRGELNRADSWRIRLDATTNWAILTAAGLLTFTFDRPENSHWALLMGLALIGVFHGFESRRFRLWHVWRTRVRMIEENFYGPILRRDLESPDEGWGKLIAQDLFAPTFKLTRLEALRARFLRNYWAIYGAITLAWVAKVFVLRPAGMSVHDCLSAGNGVLPWWSGLAYIGTVVTLLVLLAIYRPRRPHAEVEYFQNGGQAEGGVRLDF